VLTSKRILAFTRQHPCLNGHFPDNPIVPAVVIMAEISAWVEAESGRSVVGVKSARFRAALRPETTWDLVMDRSRDDIIGVTGRIEDIIAMSAKFIMGNERISVSE
jgi:3-hydroxymyristoyl/3-hydroxydecanoyl-(acyl carrier protein) dehydratase